MKETRLFIIAFSAIIIAACHTSKKTTVAAAPVPVATPPATALIYTKPAKSADGIYPPGEEELSAIQLKYITVTLDQLKEGYNIYTKGACINCHGAASIYMKNEAQWKYIIDDMAQKAQISDVQKDAVYKYVLAIKATQFSRN